MFFRVGPQPCRHEGESNQLKQQSEDNIEDADKHAAHFAKYHAHQHQLVPHRPVANNEGVTLCVRFSVDARDH